MTPQVLTQVSHFRGDYAATTRDTDAWFYKPCGTCAAPTCDTDTWSYKFRGACAASTCDIDTWSYKFRGACAAPTRDIDTWSYKFRGACAATTRDIDTWSYKFRGACAATTCYTDTWPTPRSAPVLHASRALQEEGQPHAKLVLKEQVLPGVRQARGRRVPQLQQNRPRDQHLPRAAKVLHLRPRGTPKQGLLRGGASKGRARPARPATQLGGRPC